MKDNLRYFKKCALLGFFVLLFISVWSFLIEPTLLKVHAQQKSKWPVKPIKIVFFSDLHAGSPHINEIYVKNLVEKINAVKPDLVLIGGDLVINGVLGGSFMDIGTIAEFLSHLNAPLGKFVVLGNHDWWNNAEKIKNSFTEKGFQVLENEPLLVEMDIQNKFWLVGIGDRYTNHSDPEKAFRRTDELWPKIVFMHDPASLFEIKNNFFVAFAGHLHGGQVFLPGIGALITPGDAPKKWAKGWTEFESGSLYVSQGIGTSILPLRFNSPPEFIVLSLIK